MCDRATIYLANLLYTAATKKPQAITPTTAVIIEHTRPAASAGAMSPYPTVQKVMTDTYTDSKIRSGLGFSDPETL